MAKLILPHHARPDSLAYFKSQALFTPQSMREVWVPEVIPVLRSYLSTCSLVHPESEAVSFYTGNAIWAELLKKFHPLEVLPAEAMTLAGWYVARASLTAQRLMYYLLLIITRESRHVAYHSQSKISAAHGHLYSAFNQYMGTANNSMHAKDLFLDKPAAMKMGDYVDAISYTFHHGSFGHAFGGAKWGVIADVFKSAVNGEFSPEMATDVSWALCHNGGPIFNKEMAYTGYNGPALKQILDVQRSGQMCEFVMDPAMPKNFVSPALQAMVAEARQMFPGVFGDAVDWVKVEAAGSVQKYTDLKAKQLAAQSKGKVFWVTPGVCVPVIEKKREAA